MSYEMLAWRKHAAKLQEEAFRYLLDGYVVRALVEGWFERPEYINGFLPDMIVCKGEKCTIIQVESPEQQERDTPKILAFEDYVKR